jgi:hypothetical protein
MFNLIIFLFTIVFGLGAMISYLNNSARLQLREIDTTEKRILYRKQIYRKRIKTILEVASAPIIILVFVWIGLMSIPSSTNDTQDYKMWVGMFFFLLLSIIIIAGPLVIFMYIQYKGNMSYFNKTDFFEGNKVFALYLRGFENDDYSNKWSLVKKGNKQFSEYLFTKILSKHCVCAAIGMTKELDAPLGAKRIYVDDETWKDDVAELMEKSHQIYILVNNRPSCIWEIETAVKFIEKVVLIIDDPVKYVLVQDAVKGTVTLPHIRDLTMNNRYFFLQYKDSVFECHKYYNSRDGYSEIVRYTYNDISPIC